MAFSNVRSVPLGAGIRLIIGDFTNTVGTGSQTYAVGGGRILWAHVNPQVSTEPVDETNELYSVSQSGAIATITIYANAGISAGTFVILVDAGG